MITIQPFRAMAARWSFEKFVYYRGETIQRVRRCASLISVAFYRR